MNENMKEAKQRKKKQKLTKERDRCEEHVDRQKEKRKIDRR